MSDYPENATPGGPFGAASWSELRKDLDSDPRVALHGHLGSGADPRLLRDVGYADFDGNVYSDSNAALTEKDLRELEEFVNEQETKQLQRKLHSFLKEAWPILEPNQPFIDSWHVGAICDHLQAVHDGDITRLVINIPPRHLKSLTTSVFYPSWDWTTKPHHKFLAISYSRALVLRDANKTRRLVSSPWYRVRWPHIQILADQNVKSYFENTKSGYRIIGSFDSGVTGEGGDIIIVDDPLEMREADNPAALQHVIDVWENTITSRLNDPVKGAIVIIMQRLSEMDLTGYVLKEGGWTHLMLPQEYEPRRKCVTFLPRDIVEETHTPREDALPFFSDPRQIEGELLNPERYPLVEVAKLKKRGELIYAAQQQQRPSPKGGYIFKEHWFRYYRELPQGFESRADGCISLDCAFKDLDTSSYVVLGAWGRVLADHYLIHVLRKQMNLPDTIVAFKAFCEMFPWIGPKLIEDKANGTAIISLLRKEIPGIIPVEPEGGKEARANAVSYLFQAGNVLLPENAPWKQEYTHELTTFPRSGFSDQVDMTSQALTWFEHRRAGEVSLEEILSAGKNAQMNAESEKF